MEEDGFISNLTIGNSILKRRKSIIDKKKDKKQKYLERKIIKRQNRKKYEEIIEKKKEARERLNNSENKENKNNYRTGAYHPPRKTNNSSNNLNNSKNISKEQEENTNKLKNKNFDKNENNKQSKKDDKEENESKEEKEENEEIKEKEDNVIEEENEEKKEKEENEEMFENNENISFEKNNEKEGKEEKIKEKKKVKKVISKEEKNREDKNNYEKKAKIITQNNNNDKVNEILMEIEEEKLKINNSSNKIITDNNDIISHSKKKSNSSQTIFSIKSFEELKISPYLKKALNKNNYNIMTKIQKKAIPILLEHKNVIVKSETGSGKTLAYIIPLYQNLIEINEFDKINRKNGVYSIIFSPTHELCLQIEKTFDKLKSCCINVIYGALMGGQKIETEKKKLRKGLNIIITTPGRLLYHLQNTENINFTTLKMIIIDEADLMLDMGFERDIKECFKLIIQKSDSINNNDEEIILNPDLFKKFKIFLISATIDNRRRKMSNYFMKGFKAIGFEKEDEKDKEINNGNNKNEENDKHDEEININDKSNNNKEEKKNSNVSSNYYLSALKQQNITQYYSYINDEYRLIHLIAFLYNNLFQKIIIFVSTCDLCEYLSKIIIDLEIDINYKSEISANPKDKSKTKQSKDDLKSKFIKLFSQKTYKLHGKMKHDERKIIFDEFNSDDTGILIATDVAARGLDFKNVNWVIHYDINPDIKEYINRIGRTARIDNVGNSILFLMQNERKLLDTCFKSIKNNLFEMKNSDILLTFLKNINKNILKNKINEIEDKKINNIDDEDAVDENEIYKKKYLFAISPILRCIKNFIFKDKNNLILARKAFKSEVRSYVTFLKFAKDVFNVKALNLTRMSRSFGLYKESLSMKVGTDQVNVDYQTDKKEKFTQRKFLNKKIQNKLIYSEFE